MVKNSIDYVDMSIGEWKQETAYYWLKVGSRAVIISFWKVLKHVHWQQTNYKSIIFGSIVHINQKETFTNVLALLLYSWIA